MYIVNFTFLFLCLHSLGNKPLNKWSSHHLYPGLTCNLTVLVFIKVHLQPPASSNALASLPALLEIHPKKRANSEKKKKVLHKPFSKLASLPNATCLPMVWGLTPLRGEKNNLADKCFRYNQVFNLCLCF